MPLVSPLSSVTGVEEASEKSLDGKSVGELRSIDSAGTFDGISAGLAVGVPVIKSTIDAGAKKGARVGALDITSVSIVGTMDGTLEIAADVNSIVGVTEGMEIVVEGASVIGAAEGMVIIVSAVGPVLRVGAREGTAVSSIIGTCVTGVCSGADDTTSCGTGSRVINSQRHRATGRELNTPFKII